MFKHSHKWCNWLVTGVVWLAGVSLTGASFSQATIEANAGPAPLEALKLNSNHARALANVGLNRSGDQTTAGQMAAEQYALRALARDPLNSEALRALAALKDASSDLAVSQKYLDASSRRNTRSLRTNSAVMLNAIMRGDVKRLFVALDSVMRVAPDNVVGPTAKAIALALPILPDAEDGLIESLKAKPAWSVDFLINLSGEIADPDISLRVLKRLQSEGFLDDQAVIRSWIGNLVAKRHYAQSRAAMILLGENQAAFQSTMSSLSFAVSQTVFDWSFTNSDAGISSGYEVVGADGQTKLWATTSGNSGGNIVASKLLILDEGSYQFRTLAQSDELLGLDNFKWVIGCDNNGAILGETAATLPDKPLMIDFDVPKDACEAIFVRLMTISRESLDRTQASYLDPKIQKIAASGLSQP